MLENENEQNAPQNFDEANQAVMDMFNQEENPPLEAPQTEEVPEDVTLPSEQSGTAPPEQQTPPPDVMLQQAFTENQALKQQVQQLQQTMSQMSEVQKGNITDNAMNGGNAADMTLEMPIFDVAALAYDDEATIQVKQADYQQKMAEYMKAAMMKELSPVLQYAKDGMAQKEKAEIIASLSALPEFQDFNSMIPQLDNIIAKNKALSADGVPLDERYVMAYLISNGLDSIKNRGKQNEMTPEKFMQYYQSNVELKDLIDKQRLAEIKGNQDIPQLSASNGAVNAALNIPKLPTNFDEANELTKKFFS